MSEHYCDRCGQPTVYCDCIETLKETIRTLTTQVATLTAERDALRAQNAELRAACRAAQKSHGMTVAAMVHTSEQAILDQLAAAIANGEDGK